jgi:hypothetical protein
MTEWLLDSPEPWTRYRTLRDLRDQPEEDGEVAAARAALLTHPQLQILIVPATPWPGRTIGRHNAASHALSLLADFGLASTDPGGDCAITAVLAYRSADGTLQSMLKVAPAFGGTGEDTWS